MKNHYDIIIVGCGLVGGSLAKALPQSLSICILDATTPMQKQPGFLALNRYSTQVLENLNLWQEIKESAPDATTPICSMEVFEPSSEKISLTPDVLGKPTLGHITSTQAISAVITKNLNSSSHIDWFYPEEVTHIHSPNDGLTDACVTTTKRQLHARLVILADGGRSHLRDNLGFMAENSAIFNHHTIIISRFQTLNKHKNHAYECLTSHGPIALLPVGETEYLAVITASNTEAQDLLKSSSQNILEYLKKHYTTFSFDGWQELENRKSYPLHCQTVQKPFQSRVLLMGNAAHSVHPIGAQGFNLSLKDVMTLSSLIQEALIKNIDIGSDTFLAQYTKLRAPDVAFVEYFTQLLLNAFEFEAPLFQKIRHLSFKFLDKLPGFKQKLLEKTATSQENISLLNSNIKTSINLKSEDIPTEHYDIIILGNGLIGSTLGCALKDSYKIAIIDKNSTPTANHSDSYNIRINAYNRASETLLKHLGIWSTLPKERLFAFDKVYATHPSQTQELRFNAESIGEPHIGHFIENDIVTRALHQHILKKSHIDFIDNATVINIDAHSDKNAVHIYTQNGQNTKKITGRLLAACDGGNSIARQLLNIEVSRNPYKQHCIVGHIYFEDDLDKTAWQCFQETGPLGLLPLKPGMCSLAWSCDSDYAQSLLALSDDEFIKALNKASLERMGKITHIGQRQAFPLIAQHAKTYIAERVMLLGDAAHTIHPLAGLGANLGFQDVIAAAALLNNPKTSRRDIGRRYLLESYENSRKSQNANVLSCVNVFNALFHHDYSWLNPFGPLSLELTQNFGPAKRALFKKAMWMGMTIEGIKEALGG